MNYLFRFKYRKVVAILFLITVLLTACTQPDPRPKGIFYEVTGGYNKMHILGSVHVGVEHMYPLEQNIEEIFNNSQTLVVEANIDNIDQEEISNVLYEYAFYKDGSNLSDYLDEQTLNEVKDILVPSFLTEEVLYQLKPWYIAQLITQLEQQKSKYDSEYGVDQYFLS